MDDPHLPPSPPPVSYATPTRPVAPEFLRPGVIVVDIMIIFGLTFIGGFVVAVVASSYENGVPVLALAVSSLVMASLGFFVSGLRAPPGNRWPHLLWVALGVWLTGLVNVLFGVSIAAWAVSILFVAAAMGIGGAISAGVRREEQAGQ